MRLSAHFNLTEFSVSTTHPDFVRPVPRELQGYARLLAVIALEPMRAKLGTPLQILSGYRSSQLNDAVGGSRSSQHLLAQAVDVTCTDPLAAYHALIDMLADGRCPGIGQVIFYPAARFIHVALASERHMYPRGFVSPRAKMYLEHQLTKASVEHTLTLA